MQRKRLCDGCEAVIEPGTLYVRTSLDLLRDCVDKRPGMTSTSSDVCARVETELCVRCAPDSATHTLNAAMAASRTGAG